MFYDVYCNSNTKQKIIKLTMQASQKTFEELEEKYKDDLKKVKDDLAALTLEEIGKVGYATGREQQALISLIHNYPCSKAAIESPKFWAHFDSLLIIYRSLKLDLYEEMSIYKAAFQDRDEDTINCRIIIFCYALGYNKSQRKAVYEMSE